MMDVDQVSGVPRPVVDELRGTLTWESAVAGTALASPGPGQVLFLEQGEIAVSVDGRLLEFHEGPRMLVPRSPLKVTAMSNVRCAAVSVEALAAAGGVEVVRALFEQELERIDRWRGSELRKADDFFADDQAALVPGPYRFGPYQATALIMRGPTRHVLPRGLRPLPGVGEHFLIVLSEVERCRALHPAGDGRDHRYLEVAAFVPCLGPRLVPGFFLPEVYPDAYLPILLGREVYGFAKRMGHIIRGPAGFDLVASGTHRLRARWSRESAPAAPHLADVARLIRRASGWVKPRLYLHKRVLGVRSGRRARGCVDQIVTLPFTIRSLGTPTPLADPTVTFPDRRWSVPGVAVAAAQFQLGFEFADGRVAKTHRRRSYP